MNAFGRLFRVEIFGESHGPSVGAIVDGCPAGLPLGERDFAADIARRAPGKPGTTRRRERDEVRIASGVFQGRTTGAPVALEFANEDVDSSPYRKLRSRPRPGHADLVARQKFGGFQDWRGGGHFSGRLTVALVAAGVIAKKLLPELRLDAKVLEVGGGADLDAAVARAERAVDSIGGVVELRVRGVPAGLGEPFFDSAESLLAHAAFAIPGVKAVEFGAGIAAARMAGSAFADAIVDRRGRTRTNNSGGVNGGLTNGNELVMRVAVRPPSSSAGRLQTIDLATGRPVEIVPGGRHDRCVALRVPVVLEAAAAIVLADLMALEGRIPRVLGRGGGRR